jgi:outer membrane protein assembly factor BamB
LTGDLSLEWEKDSGGPINEPPLRVGNLIIVIPQNGPLLARDANNGKTVWQYDSPQGVWDRAYASDGRLVFVGVPGGKLVALDVKNGRLRWERDLGINVQAPPIVVDGVIYAVTTFVGPGLDGNPEGKAKLFALHSGDGSLKWEFESGSYILQTPSVSGDWVYTGGGYSDSTVNVEEGGLLRLYALTAKDGSLQWENESEDGYIKAIYSWSDALAYIAYQDFTTGVDTQFGEPIWRKDTGNWVPSLVGFEDTVYYGSANTVVYAVDINDGETIWEYNIPGGSFNYLLGKPVRVLDNIYFLTQKGDVIGLNAKDGTLLWSYPTGKTARVGLRVYGEWIYFGDQDGVVYAYQDRGSR